MRAVEIMKKNIIVIGLLLFIVGLGAYLRLVHLDYGAEDDDLTPQVGHFKTEVPLFVSLFGLFAAMVR